MTAAAPLLLELEFLRAEQADDPFGFRFAPQEYLLRGEGGGVESSHLAWDDALLGDLEAVRRPGRDPVVVARIGEALRRFLAPMGWRRWEDLLLTAVNERRPVFLTVRSAAAELYSLPWELVTLKATGQHLGELPGVLLRYAWPETRSAAEPATRPEGGRILLAWSGAAGAVPAAQQLSALRQACAAGFHRFDAERDVLAHASCGRLSAALEQASHAGAPFAILHLLCHGGQAGGTFGLVLDGEDAAGGAVCVDPGRLRQLLAPHAGTLRLVVLSACDSGNSGALGNQLGSVAQALHRGGIAAVVASRHPLSVAGSIALTAALYGELLGRPASLEQALLASRHALAQDAAALDWASLQLLARPEDGTDTRPITIRPYRGLLAFQAEHARFFFGRDAERRAALAKLDALRTGRKPRFLVVAGASGTGKSSVVRSGIVPDISQRVDAAGTPLWEIAILRPGEDPLGALTAALAARQAPERRLLLVVDQLEELFTHTTDALVRREFAARLWALTQQESGVDCILTIRVDYLGSCGEIVLDGSGLRLDRVAYDDAHQLFVAQMGTAQLRLAIEGPGRQVGLALQDGLASRMIAEVDGEPGALPLLSYTLDLLWERRQGRLLTAQSYGELGGVSGALAGRANAVIDGLDAAAQAQARRILVRLVGLGEGASDTRRRVALGLLRTLEQGRLASFSAVLDAFVEARLLVLGEEQGQVTLEVAHEALIRKWERLRGWIEKDREKLAELQEVERWVSQWRGYGTLLRESQLGYALRVLEKYGDDVSPDGRELIALSQRTEDQQRRQELAQAQQRAEAEARAARRLRGTAAVLALALLAGLVLAAVARQKSRESREHLLSLLEEQGRQRLLEGDAMRAVVSLSRAYEEGSTGIATRLPLALAAAMTLDTHLLTLGDHKTSVRAAAYSPDGATIATGGDDRAARLWDARSGRLLRVLAGHTGAVRALSFSADGRVLATAGEDRTARLWSLASGQVILTLWGHEDAVHMVALSRDGTRIATASKDKTVRLWDARSGAVQLVFTGHSDEVSSARFSPDGQQVLTGSGDGTAKVWQAASGQVVRTLSGHDERVSAAIWSPDGTRIVTASQDRTAKVWDAGTGQVLFTMTHQSSVEDVDITADGQRLVTASLDQTAKLWDLRSGQAMLTLSGHENWLNAVALSPDGQRALTASDDGTARVWDIDKAPLLLAHGDSVFSARSSPDGRRIATASGDKTGQIWDAQSGRPLVTLSGHGDRVYSAEWSPDGTRIVTSSADQCIRTWDAASGKVGLTLRGHGDRVRSAVFTPDGRRILSASRDSTARLWDASDGRPILMLVGHGDIVNAAVPSPDSRRILTASTDGTARIWDAGTGQALLTLSGHVGEVSCAAYSPDGRTLITGGTDKTARLWDAESGRQLAILTGHGDRVMAVAFSPDGRFVATAGADATARLWEAASGKLLLGWQRQGSWLISVAFTPDGRRVLTAGGDKTARIEELIPESRAPAVISRKVRCSIPYRFIHEQILPVPTDPAACADRP